MLEERIREDLTVALKGSNSEEASLLRFLLAQLQNRQIEKRSTGQAPVLTEEDVITVLQREVKKRKEAIELFVKGRRNELADKEKKEIDFIQKYLPAFMGEEDIGRVVDELQRGGLNDFNSLMREAMKKLKGRADGTFVASVVKKKLGG